MSKYFVHLDDWIEIKVFGPETMEYLNGIITKDLEKIEQDTLVRSAFLTPNAKIRSIFWVKKSEEGIYLYTSAQYKQNLVEDLLKYKLSMDVTLEDITEETDPLYLAPTDERIPGLSTEELRYTIKNLPTRPEGTELTYSEWKTMMIKEGLTPIELMNAENPYEVGISDAISLEKGCFLGQEPISRMYYRGNPRKYIYAISTPEDVEGQEIKQGEDTVGSILASVPEDDQYYGLAFIRRTVDDFNSLVIQEQPFKVLNRVGTYPANDR